MAIELPWIIDAFGDVEDVYVKSGKMSSLDLSYPDCYSVIIEHANGNIGTLCIDVVSREAVRNFEVFGESLHLNWNGRADGLVLYNIESKQSEQISLYQDVFQNSECEDAVRESAYAREIENFFDVIAGRAKPLHSFDADLRVLSLIDKIEKGSA
jgi:predicted dehydrogenase